MSDNQATRFGAVIKKYRVLAKMSQADVGRLMRVSRNTVINWENGTHQPDVVTIRMLCRELGIPVGELFALSDDVALKEDEISILRAYRALSQRGKAYAHEAVCGLVRAEERELVENVRDSFFAISEFHTAPAAGSGNPFNDLPPTIRFVRRTTANARADAMVRVNGRSMEPFFHSGDYVYFCYTNAACSGDVVICSTADGAVIKAVDDKLRLYSLNDDLPYGDKYEDDNIIVQGKVLGIVQPEDLPNVEERALIEDVFAEEINDFARKYGE